MNTPHLSDGADALAALKARIATHHATSALPFVTLCYAQGLDGSIANANGTPMQISCRDAAVQTHAMRAVHDAILVGVGTVLSDNPRLTTRLVDGPSPRPVVLDSRLRTPADARLITSAASTPCIASTDAGCEDAAYRLEQAGAAVVRFPATPDAHVHLPALLAHLGSIGVRAVMVEGGSRVIASFLRERLVHAVVVTVSMCFLAGKTVLSGQAAAAPEERGTRLFPGIEPQHLFWVGRDLVIQGAPHWREEPGEPHGPSAAR
ncbi:MAG: RibD family protein [Rhodothermales bacterium]